MADTELLTLVEPDGHRTDTGRFAMLPVWLIPLVSPRALQVYVVLATYADYNSGECWPSHARIAEDVDTSAATVKRAVDELVRVGALEKRVRQNEDKSYSSNVYKVLRQKCTEVGSNLNPGQVTHEPRGGVTSELQTRTTSLTKTKERELLSEQKIPFDPVETKELVYEKIGAIKPKPTEWQQLFQAIIDACTMQLSDMTDTAKGEVGRAAKQIWDVGGRAEHIPLRAECYKQLMRKTMVTPSALAKHWPKCTPQKKSRKISYIPPNANEYSKNSHAKHDSHI